MIMLVALEYSEASGVLRHHGLLLHPALLGFFRRGAELDLSHCYEIVVVVVVRSGGSSSSST